VPDVSSDELKQIEHLLYGFNYAVSLRLYGPSNSEQGLIETLKKLISEECEISGVLRTSSNEAVIVMTNCLLYKGDEGSQPLELDSKKTEICNLLDKILSTIGFENAEMIVEFGFKQGHPAYPVFWDFAYDIHVKDKRWIFVGCSSD
jgi:hypothetical protein